MDLKPYFTRIGYTGPTTPTLRTLSDIVLCHVTSVPFENLSVLVGEPVLIDLPAISDKIITRRRGGYCFEQNTLLLHVLTELGFQVTPLSGRVRFMAPRDFTPPRTHVFLRVDIDGLPYLADVGVGGISPTSPLRLDLHTEQPTPHEPRRLLHENGRIYHQFRTAPDTSPNPWADIVEFTGEDMPLVDRELANYWTSTHPNSKFRLNLMVALARPDGTRLTIQNHELTHRRGGEVLSTRSIYNHAEMLAVLASDFGLHLPPGSALHATNLNWQS